MINILNSKESNALDYHTINSTSVSEKQLIDSAGKAIAFHIIDKITDPFNPKYRLITAA